MTFEPVLASNHLDVVCGAVEVVCLYSFYYLLLACCCWPSYHKYAAVIRGPVAFSSMLPRNSELSLFHVDPVQTRNISSVYHTLEPWPQTLFRRPTAAVAAADADTDGGGS